MGIKYAVSTPTNTFVRPTGYTFPSGLNVLGSNVSISYLVVAGGGGGTPNGEAGGSGIVIISYTSATALFTGGTITNPSPGANQIHTFTGDGSLVGIPSTYSVN